MKGKYGTTNILFLNNMISINTQRDGTFAFGGNCIDHQITARSYSKLTQLLR